MGVRNVSPTCKAQNPIVDDVLLSITSHGKKDTTHYRLETDGVVIKKSVSYRGNKNFSASCKSPRWAVHLSIKPRREHSLEWNHVSGRAGGCHHHQIALNSSLMFWRAPVKRASVRTTPVKFERLGLCIWRLRLLCGKRRVKSFPKVTAGRLAKRPKGNKTRWNTSAKCPGAAASWVRVEERSCALLPKCRMACFRSKGKNWLSILSRAKQWTHQFVGQKNSWSALHTCSWWKVLQITYGLKKRTFSGWMATGLYKNLLGWHRAIQQSIPARYGLFVGWHVDTVGKPWPKLTSPLPASITDAPLQNKVRKSYWWRARDRWKNRAKHCSTLIGQPAGGVEKRRR